MFSGEFSKKKERKQRPYEGMPEEEKNKVEIYQDGIKPQMFKSLIGQGHPEFSSAQQQDASEYLFYFLDKIKEGEKKCK